MLYALKFSGSKQIIFRRTYPELEKSLIRTAYSIYPRDIYSYTKSTHTGTFVNGSVIEGCTIGCLLWTSSTYSAASATSIDPATLTLDVFNNKMRDNLVCGQGFTANEGITIGNDSGDNNTYL